jgi:hypothetical protein
MSPLRETRVQLPKYVSEREIFRIKYLERTETDILSEKKCFLCFLRWGETESTRYVSH